MRPTAPLRLSDLLWFLLIVALAGGARFWYLSECVDGAQAKKTPYRAQAAEVYRAESDEPQGQEQLIANIRDKNWFGYRAPLALQEEETADVAPGYPWTIAMVQRYLGEADAVPWIRWGQCGLGALTAGLYFAFARMAFGNLVVALLTGVFCALNPFWIINTAEIQDGVLAGFLLAVCVVTGTRAAGNGGAFTSLIFGLSLAGASLVRAAMLPFALVGMVWFLRQCRDLPRGWFCAVLAVLGLVNGLAPWTVRNFQTFHDIVPVVDSAWLHLWIGNNPSLTTTQRYSADIKATFIVQEARLEELKQELNQNRRYKMLAEDVVRFVRQNPDDAVNKRIEEGLCFFFGQAWFPSLNGFSLRWQNLMRARNYGGDTWKQSPEWLWGYFDLIIGGTLLAMLVLGLLGWRWTHRANGRTGLATLALIWVPLPYILSHAELLWGPRLPLDGLILCYSAFALVYMIPVLRRDLIPGRRAASRGV